MLDNKMVIESLTNCYTFGGDFKSVSDWEMSFKLMNMS